MSWVLHLEAISCKLISMPAKENVVKPTTQSKSKAAVSKTASSSRTRSAKMTIPAQPKSKKSSGLPNYLTTVTPLSKIVALILFITLPFAGFMLGICYTNPMSLYPDVAAQPIVDNAPTVIPPDSDPIQAQTVSEAQAVVGTSKDFSSGDLIVNDQSVHMVLNSTDSQNASMTDFPCEENKVVLGYKGHLKIKVSKDINNVGPLGDLDIGEQAIVYSPGEIEQTGLFSKRVQLSSYPIYEAYTLAFRDSCNDTKIYFYTYRADINQVVQIPFARKSGDVNDFIMIPKGFMIPQIDKNNNVISSTYNPQTKWRNKVRYKFNTDMFRYEEIEAYSQPQ